MKKPASPYLTAAEATAYLRLGSVGSLYTLLWRRRTAGRPVTTRRLNGRLRFLAADLDAAHTVEQARPSKLRRASGF